MNKIKFIELNYHCHAELDNPEDVIQKHIPSNLFATAFSEFADINLVKHMNSEGSVYRDPIHYHFFKRSNNFFQIPVRTHRFCARLKPDLVLVQGFIFPLQVVFLRKKIGKEPMILLQHQGESPGGKKIRLQKFADRYVNGYLFSAAGNAEEWLASGIISHKKKCAELPASSTLFSKKDPKFSRTKTGLDQGIHFLWVGRLNENKDPLTVLKAFELYCSGTGEGQLSMIFSEEDWIHTVREYITSSEVLQQRVRLIGKVPHSEMEYWYSAADYFILASRKEGGSYALTEAMACGCIPIVSNIPPSMKAIGNGTAGYFFEPGDVDGLYSILINLNHEHREKLSDQVEKTFHSQNSPGAIANQLLRVYKDLKTI